MDRDVRWVGSATQRDFPSALLQFLYCVGVQPNILPPHHPELNCYVERYNKTYKQECLQAYRPGTLEEVRAGTFAVSAALQPRTSPSGAQLPESTASRCSSDFAGLSAPACHC
ncbi:MAG TPA: integrase core domain-containing protein [Ktedonosporobacter sp.]|nr:integrase core domain-containing protein [Ktedonosporobacter sp.]